MTSSTANTDEPIKARDLSIRDHALRLNPPIASRFFQPLSSLGHLQQMMPSSLPAFVNCHKQCGATAMNAEIIWSIIYYRENGTFHAPRNKMSWCTPRSHSSDRSPAISRLYDVWNTNNNFTTVFHIGKMLSERNSPFCGVAALAPMPALQTTPSSLACGNVTSNYNAESTPVNNWFRVLVE